MKIQSVKKLVVLTFNVHQQYYKKNLNIPFSLLSKHFFLFDTECTINRSGNVSLSLLLYYSTLVHVLIAFCHFTNLPIHFSTTKTHGSSGAAAEIYSSGGTAVVRTTNGDALHDSSWNGLNQNVHMLEWPSPSPDLHKSN